MGGGHVSAWWDQVSRVLGDCRVRGGRVQAAGPLTIDIPAIPGQAQAWSNPNGIAVDAGTGRAFVATYTNPGRLFVIDTTTLQIVTNVVVDPGGSMAVALNPSTRRIYVPTSSQLIVFDEDSLTQ